MPDRKYRCWVLVGGRNHWVEIICSDGLMARDIAISKYGNCQTVLGPYN